ncbi:lipid-A-disaccharide synthase [Lunatibacter salilacus]|uniref:lipid-A-disaccharide synthase n=1 Tax=Lunatibacter salilacus TaxID=2483804 RepID=UPI00131CFB7F|nr:lipid-A-disaccharide synthase [Lunatibacter salilacus]
MKYYLIAGERSGDLHASNLMDELTRMDQKAIFRGMGGGYMEKAGLQVTAHYEEMAMMGFVEVLLGFRKVIRYLSLIKKDLLNFKPDALILIDYGGFNMKIAKFASKVGIPVHYYIPPKVWAWNQRRALTLKKHVTSLYTILPFEPDFFSTFDWEVPYVGNPVRDELVKFSPNITFKSHNNLDGKPVIALLPGSRKQEVSGMLSTMLGVVRQFPQWSFVVAGVDNLPADIYQDAEKHGIKTVFNQTYDLLNIAHAAVVTSGTATLETALFNVPQVVVYKTSPITYSIAKHLVKIPFISLVNLIAGHEVVRELIQDAYNEARLVEELSAIAEKGLQRQAVLKGYLEVQEKIGHKKASQETARLIVESLSMA